VASSGFHGSNGVDVHATVVVGVGFGDSSGDKAALRRFAGVVRVCGIAI
jgi:hypothetical protein